MMFAESESSVQLNIRLNQEQSIQVLKVRNLSWVPYREVVCSQFIIGMLIFLLVEALSTL